MHIKEIISSDNNQRVAAKLDFGSDRWRVFYLSDSTPLTVNSETFIALGLLPCMRHGKSIHIQGNVSQQFLENLEKVQEFFLAWKPQYSRVAIHGVTPVGKAPSTENRVGVFFSLGVDSFYTFLKHREEITDLIFVHGFDIPLRSQTLRDQASEALHKVAAHYNKRALEIETDVMMFKDAYLPGHQAYGAILAGVGHLLGPSFSRIYIATGHTVDTLSIMEGSHPDLDPLWSTETLQFVHDGVEATRREKTGVVAESEVALTTLRVCVENRGGAYNCGRCEKCLRTMINLRLAGALDRCTTFDQPLDLNRVARIRPHGSRRFFLEDILEALEESRTDPELEAAVRQALSTPGLVTRAIKVFERLRFRGARRRRFRT